MPVREDEVVPVGTLPRILVVEDEPAMLEWLRSVIAPHCSDLRSVARGKTAERIFEEWRPDLVITDLLLPDVNGIDLVRRFKENPSVQVVVISGYGSVGIAVEAMQAGAFAFLEKPLEADALVHMVRQASRHTRASQQRAGPDEHPRDQVSAGEEIIGRHPKILALRTLIAAVAPSQANCLIIGESGTGKELVADALHALSGRAAGPFVKVNCAALPEELIEAELFGHKRGAFTGAIANNSGLLASANGGSLLLDEVGEMPAYLQTKLLRVLQERSYRPIGGDGQIALDVRLICSTNVNVDRAVREGRLREDLLFRINTVTLAVPPLRDRTDDIPLLCEHFLAKFRTRHQRDVHTISRDAMRCLVRHNWPGNVRELESVIERAVLMSPGREIGPIALPEAVRVGLRTAVTPLPPNLTLDEIEKIALEQTLERTQWNKQQAASILGIYRPTLYNKMRRHGIAPRRRRDVPIATDE
jgi:DNA-binding NtrC family response regulator